jgi:hypothetical protein
VQLDLGGLPLQSAPSSSSFSRILPRTRQTGNVFRTRIVLEELLEVFVPRLTPLLASLASELRGQALAASKILSHVDIRRWGGRSSSPFLLCPTLGGYSRVTPPLGGFPFASWTTQGLQKSYSLSFRFQDIF